MTPKFRKRYNHIWNIYDLNSSGTRTRMLIACRSLETMFKEIFVNNGRQRLSNMIYLLLNN
jgi:hypothetical protein